MSDNSPANQIDVARTLELLIRLQEVAEEGFNLLAEKEETKRYLTKLEKLKESEKNKLMILEDEIAKITHDTQKNQSEIQIILEEITKLKEKEKMIKTQKEYLALDTERTLKREKIQEIEKSNEEHNKKLEELNGKLDKQKNSAEDSETNYTQTKEESELKFIEIEEKVKDFESVREEVSKELNPQLLDRFETIAKNKNGIGIVPVVDGICEGCNIAVTPALIGQLKRKDEIIFCINCARMLYLPEKVSIF